MRATSIWNLFVLAVLLALPASVNAQTFQLLHTFEATDGAVPGALTMDQAGNLYGSTSQGGMHNCSPYSGCGTVFELAPVQSSWAFATLYKFQNRSDGWNPASPLTMSAGGILYGATVDGGIEGGGGTVFSLKRTCIDLSCRQIAWTKITLYRFGQCDGAGTNGGLVFDRMGNLYGTTIERCGHTGQVYELSPAQGTWTKTVLHIFQGGPNDGRWPESPVLFDQAGNLYGTTLGGGTSDLGTVYQMSPVRNGWTEALLHSFTGQDGMHPVGNLIFDHSGSLYGITYGDAQPSTAFELTPAPGSWNFGQLYSFHPAEAQFLTSGFVMDSSGNLYGVGRGGVYGQGTVYKLTHTGNGWSYSSIYDFTGGSDGANPSGPLVLDANGRLFGSATSGGDLNCNPGIGCGTVWMIGVH
jgi:uncharacterized repeat protein (TIGR03803 family)